MLMEQAAYDSYMDQIAMIIEAGRLEIVAKESKEQTEADEKKPPYIVENGVAKFAINGPMSRYPTSFQSLFGGTATLPLQRAVSLARNDGFVNAGFFEICSPGGTTEGLEDFCAELARFRSVKPLRMHFAGQGTSAAQRVGIEADVLTIDPMGIAGSVGTLTRMRDTSELAKRAGIKEHYIASGDRKTHGAPGTEVTADQISERKTLVEAINRSFLQAVESRRPRTKEHIKDIARAGLYAAQEAVEVGLADMVMTTDDAFSQFTQRIPFGSGRTLPG
jgi:capsid assembly protease